MVKFMEVATQKLNLFKIRVNAICPLKSKGAFGSHRVKGTEEREGIEMKPFDIKYCMGNLSLRSHLSH